MGSVCPYRVQAGQEAGKTQLLHACGNDSFHTFSVFSYIIGILDFLWFFWCTFQGKPMILFFFFFLFLSNNSGWQVLSRVVIRPFLCDVLPYWVVSAPMESKQDRRQEGKTWPFACPWEWRFKHVFEFFLHHWNQWIFVILLMYFSRKTDDSLFFSIFFFSLFLSNRRGGQVLSWVVIRPFLGGIFP